MTMKISRMGNIVFLEGVIDENADFSPLLKMAPPLRLDFSGVTRINSIGVRSWMKFINLWGDNPLEYLECPSIISDQLSITPVLLGLKKKMAEVKSAYISYSCSSCHHQEELRVERSQVFPIVTSQVTSPNCKNCGSHLDLIYPDQLAIFRP